MAKRRNRIGVISALALAVYVPGGTAAVRRTITVEDSVSTRRIVAVNDSRTSLIMAPDGGYVAYVVKEPNLKTNRNDYILLVRGLTASSKIYNGRRLARHEKIADLNWLADNRRITLLASDGDRTFVETVDIETGIATRLPGTENIASYSVDKLGLTYVSAVRVPRTAHSRQKETEKYGFPVASGTVIDLDDSFPEYKPLFEIYLQHRSGNAWVRRKVSLTSEPGKTIDHFENLAGISVSPNGQYFTFSYVPDSIPSLWENSSLTKWLVLRGFRPEALVLYNLKTNKGEIGFNAPQTSSFRASWSGDSQAFSLPSLAPVGSAWEERDRVAGFVNGAEWASYSHLYTVDISTKKISEALFTLPSWKENGITSWPRKDGPMLVRLQAQTFAWLRRSGNAWEEVSRFSISIPDANLNAGWTMNRKFVVGLSESSMVAPEVVLYNMDTRTSAILTDLNPEFRNIDLGSVEPVEWRDKYEEPCTGFLIKPVGYVPGNRYPLVIMSKGWVPNFFYTDTFHRTAFAPQSLAAAGFVVLLATRPEYSEDLSKHEEWRGFPGQLAEVYRWMAGIEAGVDFLDSQKMIDRDRVGIVGFSRTSWYVDFMLTHSDFHFAAASSADSGLYNYGGYWMWNAQSVAEDSEAEMGGPPYGSTFENWLKYSPAFNAGRVGAPLLMEYTKETAFGPLAAYEFFTALHRQGKPVELFYYPNGKHELDTPWERTASLRRNLEWFRFWLQDFEEDAPSYDSDQYVRWRKLRSDRNRSVANEEKR